MNAPFLAAGRLEQFKKTRTEWVVRKATIELKFENQRICWSFFKGGWSGPGLDGLHLFQDNLECHRYQ